jgi:hypothetical protein
LTSVAIHAIIDLSKGEIKNERATAVVSRSSIVIKYAEIVYEVLDNESTLLEQGATDHLAVKN